MSITKKHQIDSLSAMEKFSSQIAKQVLRLNTQRAVVLALQGELGAGKTTFVQGLAQELGIKERITSPTFVVMKKFSIFNASASLSTLSQSKGFQFSNKRYLYHIDCYRLQGPEDLLVLGFQEIIADPRNIVAIEWADKIKPILPKQTFWLFFQHKLKNAKNTRLLLTNF